MNIMRGSQNINSQADLNSFSICEPLSSISDVFLAIICLVMFFLLRNKKTKNNYVIKWSRFFLFLSLSTFFGAIAHTITQRENNICYSSAWLSMQMFSGLSLFFAQHAVINSEINSKKIRELLFRSAITQLLVFIPCVFYYRDFEVVAINSLVGLTELIILCFPSSTRNRVHRTLISSGLLISFATVYVNRAKISLAPWFNHNDISHIIMLASMILIYRGVAFRHHLDSLFENK